MGFAEQNILTHEGALHALDVNGDGEISMIEFIRGLRKDPDLAARLHLPSSFQQESEARSIFQLVFGEMDLDDSKSISKDEFLAFYEEAVGAQGGAMKQ
ncbi:hypothetical protein T484DRAFT_1855265 [Baffinella frigidus]|nr:hypothetical protein T484DRAFT_1855265 [Cryptophyta sp. CCMP2293]